MSNVKLVVVYNDTKTQLISVVVFWIAFCLFLSIPFIKYSSFEIYENNPVMLMIMLISVVIPVLITLSFFKQKKLKNAIDELKSKNQNAFGHIIDCQFHAIVHCGNVRQSQSMITINVENEEFQYLTTDWFLIKKVQKAINEKRSVDKFKVYKDNANYYVYRDDIVNSVK